MGLFDSVFKRMFNHKENEEYSISAVFENQVRQDGVPLAAKRIAALINEKISSRELAKRFVLEELDAARQGDIEDVASFVKESGFSPSEYIGAMQKTKWEGNKSELEHIQLFMRNFTYRLSDKILMCKLGIAMLMKL